MRRCASLILLLTVASVVGCTLTPRDPATFMGHPANAQAPVMPLPSADDVLVMRRVPTSNPAEHMHGEHGQGGTGATSAPNIRSTGQIFTCPHHPEIRSIRPGECPKCGMQLVPAQSQPQTRPTTLPSPADVREHHGGQH